MGIYLYCIVPRDHHPPAALRGLDDRPVVLAALGEIACWVSDLSARPEPSLEGLQTHDRVARAAVSVSVSPLPARFGQWFPDGEALRARLSRALGGYEEALAHVAGSVEFGTRIGERPRVAAEQPPRAGGLGPGASYLRTIAGAKARADVAAARERRVHSMIEEALREVVIETRDPRTPSARGANELAHLVRLGDVEDFRSAVAALSERYPELRLVLTGPWPPYSFAP